MRLGNGILQSLILGSCIICLYFICKELPPWRQFTGFEQEQFSRTFLTENKTNDYGEIKYDSMTSFRKNSFLFDGSDEFHAAQNLEAINLYSLNFSGILNLSKLAYILDKKLKAVNLKEKIKQFKPTCDSSFKIANSCDNKCLQKELPENLTTRIEQLVVPQKLQMSPNDHAILRKIADEVMGNYDIILLTAASSNHFAESKGLLKSLHENVYPYLKNFTLIFYNLGLTVRERALLVKYCKCQVKDFPFDKFPQFMTSLSCYTWKPVLIKAHLQKANIVFWMDASIRFQNSSTNLKKFVQATRERGVQIGGSRDDSTFRTHQNMYHFFGDEPCAYLTLGQAEANHGIYHREYFVDRVILEPMVACALNGDCMCLKGKAKLYCTESNRVAQNYYHRKGPLVYGLCHRYDQSAISLILHKLYQEVYPWVLVNMNSVLNVRRDHIVSYFPEKE